MSEASAAANFLEVHIEWKGLYHLAYADYALSPDEFLRKLKKRLNDIGDPDLDRRGLYFLCSGTDGAEGVEVEDLLFLGCAFREDLRVRIADNRLAGVYREVLTEGRNRDVFLAFGVVTFVELGNEPRRMYTDLENALVYQNQPICNHRGKDAYASEDNMDYKIKNTGEFFPLEEAHTTTH